jgi:hypothetical protein
LRRRCRIFILDERIRAGKARHAKFRHLPERHLAVAGVVA